MKRNLAMLLLVIGLPVFTGCATSYSLVPSSDKAVIRTQPDSMWAGVNLVSTPPTLVIQEVDGQKAGTFMKSAHEMLVSPGKHELTVSCTGYNLAGYYGRSIPVFIEAQAGKIYELKAKDSDCNILVE